MEKGLQAGQFIVSKELEGRVFKVRESAYNGEVHLIPMNHATGEQVANNKSPWLLVPVENGVILFEDGSKLEMQIFTDWSKALEANNVLFPPKAKKIKENLKEGEKQAAAKTDAKTDTKATAADIAAALAGDKAEAKAKKGGKK